MEELVGEVETIEQKTNVQRGKISRHTANGEMLMICAFCVSMLPLLVSFPLWMAGPRGFAMADWTFYYELTAVIATVVGLFSWIALRAKGKAKKAAAMLVAQELEIT